MEILAIVGVLLGCVALTVLIAWIGASESRSATIVCMVLGSFIWGGFFAIVSKAREAIAMAPYDKADFFLRILVADVLTAGVIAAFIWRDNKRIREGKK